MEPIQSGSILLDSEDEAQAPELLLPGLIREESKLDFYAQAE